MEILQSIQVLRKIIPRFRIALSCWPISILVEPTTRNPDYPTQTTIMFGEHWYLFQVFISDSGFSSNNTVISSLASIFSFPSKCAWYPPRWQVSLSWTCPIQDAVEWTLQHLPTSYFCHNLLLLKELLLLLPPWSMYLSGNFTANNKAPYSSRAPLLSS